MRIRKNLHSGVLMSVALILLLIFISSIASADSSMVTETQITSSGSAFYPFIWKDKIVWEDGRNGGSDIYMYDLSNDTETRITTSGRAFDPRIYGNRIVWRDQRNLGQYGLLYGDIYMYDLSASRETQITNGGSVWRSPAIYGDRLIYSKAEDIYAYDLDVYLYNLSTSKETWITSSGKLSGFSIYGDRIICDDMRDGLNLCMYNLSTSNETLIPVNGNPWCPEIYDNRIVWYDTRNGPNNFDVYMYDLFTSNETQITTGGNSLYPAIYYDKIVWQNNTFSSEANIYMYNISTSIETQITTSGNAYYPSIYDNKIVWADERNGSSDIYMATIGYSPVAAFCACSISGRVPLIVKFIDKSTGSPTSWSWSFGDKCTSTSQNPVHKYKKVGKYTVSLTVKNTVGSSTKTISNYITVKK